MSPSWEPLLLHKPQWLHFQPGYDALAQLLLLSPIAGLSSQAHTTPASSCKHPGLPFVFSGGCLCCAATSPHALTCHRSSCLFSFQMCLALQMSAPMMSHALHPPWQV